MGASRRSGAGEARSRHQRWEANVSNLSGVEQSLSFLCLLAPFGQLMLAEGPLVALDRHAAVFADRDRTLFVPVGTALAHQLAPRGINAPALLVAAQRRCGGDEPRLQAAEEQEMSPKVLGVEGGGHPDCCCHYP